MGQRRNKIFENKIVRAFTWSNFFWRFWHGFPLYLFIKEDFGAHSARHDCATCKGWAWVRLRNNCICKHPHSTALSNYKCIKICSKKAGKSVEKNQKYLGILSWKKCQKLSPFHIGFMSKSWAPLHCGIKNQKYIVYYSKDKKRPKPESGTTLIFFTFKSQKCLLISKTG